MSPGRSLSCRPGVDHQRFHRRQLQRLAACGSELQHPPRQRRAVECLDVGRLRPLARRAQGDRQPGLAGAAGAADAVRVGFRIVGDVVAHHQRQRHDVQPARGHVGGHQHRAAVVGEAHQHLVAVALLHVAVQGQRGMAAAVKLLRHRVDVLAHVAEHQRLVPIGAGAALAGQQLRQRVHFLGRFQLDELLLDRRPLLHRCRHRHHHRIVLHARAHRADLLRVGGREQQRLMMLGDAPDDVVDRLAEAHVEHAVGLVQHQHADAAAVQAAALQMFLHAPRGAHHDVRIVRQRGQLRPQRHAAAQGQQLHVGDVRRQLAQRLADLIGQLARGAQHQRLQADRVGVE